MTREERKFVTAEKKRVIKEEKINNRQEKKSWNWMVRKAKSKGAWIED